jgi:solute carrier family 25 (mitochondrial carnitine/acylcarnitine transporter), member 20/29
MLQLSDLHLVTMFNESESHGNADTDCGSAQYDALSLSVNPPIHRHLSLHPLSGVALTPSTLTDQKSEDRSMIFGMVAGAGFGAVSTVTGYPLDVLKTRMQLQKSQVPRLRDHIRYIYSQEGLRGFYRGLLSPLLGVTASRSILFVVASYTKATCNQQEYLAQEIPYTGGLRPAILMSAIVFGSTRAIAETTFELFKVQSIIHSPAWLRQYYKSQGAANAPDRIRRLFQGFTPNLLRSVVGLGTFYVAADSMDRNLPDLVQVPYYGAFCKGAVSGSLATTLSFPFDSVKSVRQADLPSSTPNRASRFTTLSAMRQLYQEQGFRRGLYRGYTAGLARAFIANGCAMVAFTVLTDWQHHHWE